ncbi:transaldolase [Candidatus Woesearchaeota archaeon]|nr:transaldolase [Candidatus Woesearchaeota archaeon]MCF8013024.1 transaldolase [Candidatus Woesearchaeota archaeon]
MKIFLDSADIDEIKEAYSYGIIDGITTNPSLIKKAVDTRITKGEKIDMKKYITEILKVAKGTPVSLEVTETTYDRMIHQGRKLYKTFNPIAKNVVIKIPINTAFTDSDDRQMDGIRTIATLSKEKIPINCTLIFTPEQALLAAKAGAKYVSPFAGRIDDEIRDLNRIKYEKHDYFPLEGLEKGKVLEDNGVVSGIDLIEQCIDIIDMYELETEVLGASIRNARQTRECALAGADIATLPLNVIQDLLKHHKTYEGMQKFTKDIVIEYMHLMNGFKKENTKKNTKRNKFKKK